MNDSTTAICHICGQSYSTADLSAHQLAAHPVALAPTAPAAGTSRPPELSVIVGLMAVAGSLLCIYVLTTLSDLFDLFGQGEFGRAFGALLGLVVAFIAFYGFACIAVARMLWLGDRAGRPLAYVVCGTLAFSVFTGSKHDTTLTIAAVVAIAIIVVLAASPNVRAWFTGPNARHRDEPTSIVVARSIGAAVGALLGLTGVAYLVAGTLKSSFVVVGILLLAASVGSLLANGQIRQANTSARVVQAVIMVGSAVAIFIADSTSTASFVAASLAISVPVLLWLPDANEFFLSGGERARWAPPTGLGAYGSYVAAPTPGISPVRGTFDLPLAPAVNALAGTEMRIASGDERQARLVAQHVEATVGAQSATSTTVHIEPSPTSAITDSAGAVERLLAVVRAYGGTIEPVVAATSPTAGLPVTAAVAPPPVQTVLGGAAWAAVAHAPSEVVLAALRDVGLTHVATEGSVASVVGPGVLGSVMSIGATAVEVRLWPTAGHPAATFAATVDAVAGQLRARDPGLIEHPTGPVTGPQPAVVTARTATLSPFGALGAFVIAVTSGLVLYGMAPNQLPEWTLRALVPFPSLAVPIDTARAEFIGLLALSSITLLLALARQPAARVFAVLTGLGAIGTVIGGAAYLGSQTSASFVPDLFAPKEIYGVYAFLAAAVLVLAFVAVPSQQGNVRALSTLLGCCGLAALAVWGSTAAHDSSSISFSTASLGRTSTPYRSTYTPSYNSTYTPSYTPSTSYGTTSGGSNVPTVSSFGAAATCAGLPFDFSPIQFFPTNRFEVTICRSSSGTYGYHGRARSDGSTISLPATFDGSEYTAVNGSFRYVVDGTAVRVYQNDELVTVEAVNNGTSPAITSSDVLSRLAALIETAHDGRTMVHQLADGLNASCGVSGSDASSTISAIISNRSQMLQAGQSLLAQAGNSPAPVSQFITAMQDSLNADNAWQRWISREWVPYANSGCGSGIQYNGDPDWDAYLASSSQSTFDKRALVDAFDPLAAQAGLKSDWTDADV